MPTELALAIGATLTALATGLGALPFARRRPIGPAALGLAGALAAGVMVGAAVGLLREGIGWSGPGALAGLAAGALLVVGVRHRLPPDDALHVAGLSGAPAAQAVLILVVMTAHSAAEGIGLGVAYGGGEALGVATTIAIALHNVPEGLAIALVMVPRGASVPAAAGWAVVSSLPQPLLAVPAYLLVEQVAVALPVGLGLAAGAMAWMAAAELMPDAVGAAGRRPAWAIATGAGAAMLAVQALLGA